MKKLLLIVMLIALTTPVKAEVKQEAMKLDLIDVVLPSFTYAVEMCVNDGTTMLIITTEGEIVFKTGDKEMLRMTSDGDYIINGNKIKNSKRIKRKVTEWIEWFDKTLEEEVI